MRILAIEQIFQLSTLFKLITVSALGISLTSTAYGNLYVEIRDALLCLVLFVQATAFPAALACESHGWTRFEVLYSCVYVKETTAPYAQVDSSRLCDCR
jgi:hypothetical protein